MVKAKRVRGRAWCFTLNNPSNVQVDSIRHLEGWDGCVRYLVCQEEVGEEEGTRHLQGYMELLKRFSLSSIKKLIPGAHFEQRRGTQAQAVAYSKKISTRVEDGIVIEFGVMARSKCCSDLIESIENGACLSEIAEQFPQEYMRNFRGIEALKGKLTKKRFYAMKIEVFWGPTGTGKSFTAWKENPNAYEVTYPKGSSWFWQGYEGQETVILDEFASQIKLQDLLRLLDRYPFSVDQKHGGTQFTSKKIVICSNFDPSDWYAQAAFEGREALGRRLREYGKVWKFDERILNPEEDEVVRELDERYSTDVDSMVDEEVASPTDLRDYTRDLSPDL